MGVLNTTGSLNGARCALPNGNYNAARVMRGIPTPGFPRKGTRERNAAPLGHWPTTPAILRPHSSPAATQMVYGSFNSAPYSQRTAARTGLKRSGRAMLERSIADEVEAAIKAGSTEKHLDTLRQVTDLFLLSADGYSGEQIELFGDVLERLIRTVELRALADVSARIALAEMSTQFASIKQAPPAVVRRLAHNDEISIARPVLTEFGAAVGRGSGRARRVQGRAASARDLRALVAHRNRHRRAAPSGIIPPSAGGSSPIPARGCRLAAMPSC